MQTTFLDLPSLDLLCILVSLDSWFFPLRIRSPLILRECITDLPCDLFRTRDVLLRQAVSTEPLLQVDREDAEGEEIPKLRRGRDGTDIIEVNWLYLLTDEGRLIHDDDLVSRHDDEIEAPVEVRLEDIEEDEGEPEDRDERRDPSHGPSEPEGQPKESCEEYRNDDLPENREEEGEAVIVGLEYDALITMAETPFDLFHVGLKGEEAHGRTILAPPPTFVTSKGVVVARAPSP